MSTAGTLETLKPYERYKDSRVPWLGDVPEHWDIMALGRIGRFFKGNGGTKADEAASGVPCIRYGDLYTSHEFFITSSRSFISQEQSADYTPILYGDVLFAASGETIEDIGRSAVNLMSSRACCGGDVLVLRPRRGLDPKFLGYVSDSPASKHQKACMGRGFTVVHIYADQLKSLMVAMPPLPEQVAVAHFLDHVNRRVRRHILAKQKLIKLLAEQKQTFILRAVTRGLDANVRMKPSGLEWFGDVPEHWKIRPAKRLYREVDERSTTGTEELLSVSHITGVTPRSQKNITMFMASSYVGHKLTKPGDLVINTMWAWMGALGVSRQTGIVSPSYGVYRPLRNSTLNPEYADLLLRTNPYVSEYICRSTGITSSRLRLYPDDFLRIKVVCPPLEEQQAILKQIAVETAVSDRAIANARQEIDLLREYLFRLTSDVVTGKLDVRKAAAQLPDEVEEPDELLLADETLEGGDEAGLASEELVEGEAVS